MGPTSLAQRLSDINYKLSWSAHRDAPSWGGYLWTKVAGPTMELKMIRKVLGEKMELTQEVSLELKQLRIHILTHYHATEERNTLLDSIHKLMHPEMTPPASKESTPLNVEADQIETMLSIIKISQEDENLNREEEISDPNPPDISFKDPISMLPSLSKRLKFLDINQWQGNRFPEQIYGLRHLRLLMFGFEKRQPFYLEPRPGEWQKLESLVLKNCFMLKIPPKLAELPFLKSLYFLSSEILKIDLTPFTRIKQLSFYGTPLGTLPLSIIHLKDLTGLTCTKCFLNELPNQLGELTKLETLDITRNPHLMSLPVSLGNLSCLREIRCDLEHLPLLPPSLVNCTRLEQIVLTDGTVAWNKENPPSIQDFVSKQLP